MVHRGMYSRCMLTVSSRLDTMNRLEGSGSTDWPSSDLGLNRSNDSNGQTCMREQGLVGSRTQGRSNMFSLENPQFLLELREDANHSIGTHDNELGTNGFTELHGSAPAQKEANR